MIFLQGGKGCCGDGMACDVCVYTCMWRGTFPLHPPQSVDDLLVVSDKGRATGEHSAKNAVEIQLN